jgi:hypothetical protein
MAETKSEGNLTLFEARQILQGSRAPGDTRAQRAHHLRAAGYALGSLGVHALRRGATRILTPTQWDQLARLPAHLPPDDDLLPTSDGDALIGWIASAPERYASLAVELGTWFALSGDTVELYCRLLRGDAGPHARAVVPEAGIATNDRFSALLDLPRHELEAITAPHAGAWPCYADRLIAGSEAWQDRESEELFDALMEISSEDAAEWAISTPWHYDLTDEAMLLLDRLPPSPKMLEIVERHAVPEFTRELLAAQVGRQLQDEIPPRNDDLPQMEMI